MYGIIRKVTIMNTTIAEKKAASCDEQSAAAPDRPEAPARRPHSSRTEDRRSTPAEGIATRTQIVPDDIPPETFGDPPYSQGSAVSDREISEENVAVNPDIESMESRG